MRKIKDPIIHPYVINIDPMNVTLCKINVVGATDSKGQPRKNAGEEREDPIGYFPSVETALFKIRTLLQQDTDVDNVDKGVALTEYLQEYTKITNLMREAKKKIDELSKKN